MGNLFFRSALRLGLSLLFVGTAAVAAATSYQFGPLRVDVPEQPTVNFPMDGAKGRLVITNNGLTTLDYFNVQVTVKETGAVLIPVPTAPSIAPGASRTLSSIFEDGLLNLPTGVATTRTLVWNIGGYGSVEMPISVVNWGKQNGDLVEPPAGQGIAVSVRVVDAAGNPLYGGSVRARAGSHTVTMLPTGSPVIYGATLPPSDNWIVSAEFTGRRTGWLVLSDASRYTGQTLVLPTQNVSVTYGPARVLESGIGPWMGRDSAAGDLILLSNAMEHWRGSIVSSITQAKARLYTLAGEKRWEYAAGYETKAVDLSADGRWALVATLDPSQSSSGVAGPDGSVTLLDAATGQVQWQYLLNTTYMNSPPPPPGPQPVGGRKLGVRELRFSPDATVFALGDNLGDLTLVRRTDPTRAAWSANLGGDVRAIRFSADSSTVYGVFGSGMTAAFRVADGMELWRTETYSWAHPEGFVISPDGKRIGLMTATGDVLMLDAATGRVIWQVDTKRLAWWASFSGDGSVFLAGTQTGATIAYDSNSGVPLFSLGGGKGGGFPRGKGYFLHGNFALYDQSGTRLSNFITGIEGVAFGNWQVAAVSPDGLSIILAEQQSETATQPVVFHVSGQSSTLSSLQQVSVGVGWNLLGNASQASMDVANNFSDASRFISVWKWLAGQRVWALYAPSLAAQGGTAQSDYLASNGYELLTTISGGEGFWVNAKLAGSVSLPGGNAISVANLGPKLSQGWNLVAVGETVTPQQLCDAQSGGVTSLWSWDATRSAWYFYSPALAAQGGTALMDHISSKGYLDFTSNNKTLGQGLGFWVNKP